MPWERILWQFNVTKHLFIPVVLLKIMWSVGGTFLIEKYKVIYGEAYNISDDDEGLTLGEYAEYIASLANLKVRYEIENNESVSKATYALLDTRKIKNIGWEPQYSVKDGLKRTYTIKKETLGSM